MAVAHAAMAVAVTTCDVVPDIVFPVRLAKLVFENVITAGDIVSISMTFNIHDFLLHSPKILFLFNKTEIQGCVSYF